jgi:cell shape-determining protein MreC
MTSSYAAKLDQYRHEYLTWKRMLEFFKQENAYLKTRLSEVVDRNTDKEFLALAEHFQNQFIIKDEFMDELRHDVNEIESTIKLFTGLAKITPDKKIEAKQNKLRNEMEYLEKNFTQLKNEFNKYLVSVL